MLVFILFQLQQGTYNLCKNNFKSIHFKKSVRQFMTETMSLSYCLGGGCISFIIFAFLFHQVASFLLLNVNAVCWSFAGGTFLMEKNIYFFLQNKETYEPLCKVPLMTSSKEEQKLIQTSNKVVCYLFYIMCNIKYF